MSKFKLLILLILPLIFSLDVSSATLPVHWNSSELFKIGDQNLVIFTRFINVGKYRYPVAQASYHEVQSTDQTNFIAKNLMLFQGEKFAKVEKAGITQYSVWSNRLNRNILLSFKQKGKMQTLLVVKSRGGYQDVVAKDIDDLRKSLQEDGTFWDVVKNRVSTFSQLLLLDSAFAEDKRGGWSGLYQNLMDLVSSMNDGATSLMFGEKKSNEKLPIQKASMAGTTATLPASGSSPKTDVPSSQVIPYEELKARYDQLMKVHNSEINKMESEIIAFEKSADSLLANFRLVEKLNIDLADHSTEWLIEQYLNNRKEREDDLANGRCDSCKQSRLDHEINGIASYLEAKNDLCHYYANLFDKLASLEAKIFEMANNLQWSLIVDISNSRTAAELKLNSDTAAASSALLLDNADKLKSFKDKKSIWIDICMKNREMAQEVITKHKDDLWWKLGQLLTQSSDQLRVACEEAFVMNTPKVEQPMSGVKFYDGNFLKLNQDASRFFQSITNLANCAEYLKLGGAAKDNEQCQGEESQMAVLLYEKQMALKRKSAELPPCEKNIERFIEILNKSKENKSEPSTPANNSVVFFSP